MFQFFCIIVWCILIRINQLKSLSQIILRLACLNPLNKSTRICYKNNKKKKKKKKQNKKPQKNNFIIMIDLRNNKIQNSLYIPQYNFKNQAYHI